MINIDILQPFALSLFLGALLGFERAFTSRLHDESGDILGGIRTFSLVSVFGCTAAFLDAQEWSGVLLVSFIGVIMITVASYVISYYKHNERGITTEISILIAFTIGVMAQLRHFGLAAAVAVVVAIILYLKETTAALNRQLEPADIRAVLKFSIVSFVVLPLFDPGYALLLGDVQPLRALIGDAAPGLLAIELVNPHTVWLMVVLISGIGFTGYVLTKTLGSRKGIGLTGLLGGLVSSTATTLEFAKRSREAESHSLPFALAIFLACTTMFPRVLVEVLLVNPALAGSLAVTMGSMALAGVVVCLVLWKRSGTEKTEEVPLKNPFAIIPAIKFGLLYAAIVLISRVMGTVAGDSGLYIVSALSGLTDVDAITLSMSQISKQDPAKLGQATTAITLAAFSNTLMKGIMAASVGSLRVRRAAVIGFGAIIAVGAAALIGLHLL